MKELKTLRGYGSDQLKVLTDWYCVDMETVALDRSTGKLTKVKMHKAMVK